MQIDPELYRHLRAIAGKMLAQQPGRPVTLQPTALLHEAWLKLDKSGQSFEGRSHFVAVAAKAMRQIVVDHARARAAVKRGGHLAPTTLSGVGELGRAPVDVLMLDRALTELEALDARAARVVLLRVFGGLTVPEVAAAEGVSARSVNNDWRFAKAWLVRKLGEPDLGDQRPGVKG